MDVYCATCQEPWEHYHMLHDEPWEAWDGIEGSPSHRLIKKFKNGPKNEIPKWLRDELAEKGWKFGRSIVTILECPCCGPNAAENDDAAQARKELRIEAEALLGDDLDGLISTLTSVDQYAE